MPTVLAILPEGFEELEAVAPIDVLRRAGVQVTVAALGNERLVNGRNGLALHADTTLAELDRPAVSAPGTPSNEMMLHDALMLPGGPGVKLLRQDPRVNAIVLSHHAAGRWIAAICAAPTVLHDAGLLTGRGYTAHPAVADELREIRADDRVVVDGNLVTSRGAGTALDFGLKLVELLVSPEEAKKVADSICA